MVHIIKGHPCPYWTYKKLHKKYYEKWALKM
jgi:hypothetical protein